MCGWGLRLAGLVGVVGACVSVCVRACLHACVCACVRACVRACLSAYSDKTEIGVFTLCGKLTVFVGVFDSSLNCICIVPV